jgi:hypothetical protein
MVSMKSVEEQLKHIKFNHLAWGRAEVRELPKILMEGEEIYECVNGIYEGGFALLVATDLRVLLVDKKPLNFLTVENLRFDMISEIDYSHRLFGARISISAGSKNLKFNSYNQPRLRKLITHVQHCMAESKKQQSDHQEDQVQHLEKINQQLQAYLLAQHQYQEKIHEQLQQSLPQGKTKARRAKVPDETSTPLRPSPELSDYLFAQSLLAEHRPSADGDEATQPPLAIKQVPLQQPAMQNSQAPAGGADSNMADLYAEGMHEIFGKRQQGGAPAATAQSQPGSAQPATISSYNPLEINSLRIAYSKLPMALRNRRFGRPSFHAHSQTVPPVQAQPISAQ